MLIKVKASADRKVLPDYMALNFSLSYLSDDKEVSMKGVLDSFHLVEKFLKDKGVTEEIQSSSYTVSEKYDDEYEEYMDKGIKKTRRNRIFKGFLATQRIFVKIPIDIKLVLSAIAELSKKDEVYVNANYYLKNKKDFQDLVIKDALNRAREKAEVIAASMIENPKVEITLADYTYREYDSSSNYHASVLCMNEVSEREMMIEDIAKTINPEEITLSESVYTEWNAMDSE